MGAQKLEYAPLEILACYLRHRKLAILRKGELKGEWRYLSISCSASDSALFGQTFHWRYQTAPRFICTEGKLLVLCGFCIKRERIFLLLLEIIDMYGWGFSKTQILGKYLTLHCNSLGVRFLPAICAFKNLPRCLDWLRIDAGRRLR